MRIAVRTFLLLVLLACWLPAVALAQSAQPQAQPAPRPAAGAAAGMTGAEIDRLSDLLRDDGRRAELLRTLEALSAASRAQQRPAAAGGGAAPAPRRGAAAG